LKPNQVACIAQVPGVLQVQKTDAGRQAKLNRAVKNARVAICDASGKELQSQTVAGPRVLLPEVAGAAQIKLFSGKYLVDITAIEAH
jgi:hypothetical protein